MTTSKFDELIADIRAKLCAEYEASPELKAEFVESADYAAFTLNEPTALPIVERWRQDAEAIEAEAAIRRAQKAGLLPMVQYGY